MPLNLKTCLHRMHWCFDDILPVFDSTQIYGYPYKLKTKTFKEYYSGLVYEFPEGLTVSNKKLTSVITILIREL